jgi:filamentous hemagglutinin
VQVLNAGNIQTGGSSVGTPVVSAPNLGNLTAASNAAGAQNATAAETGPRNTGEEQQALPSIITVEVLGYGGGEGDPADTEDEAEKRRRRQEQEQAPQGFRRPTPPVIASSTF